MSAPPTYVGMPVQGDGAQNSETDPSRIASAIQDSLNDKTHPEGQNREDQQRDGQYREGPGTKDRGPQGQDEQEQTGPLKEIIARQDSLYKYISWEDPLRTLGSYLGALGILFAVHYLPITQLALKAGAVTLGVMSVTEFASRQFGPGNFLARLRPKEYKQVPESTLNATLKDIHDSVQYAVVQAQRIIFAHDLDKTFVAFLGLTALFWLVKVLPPFGLAILGLTSIYLSPRVTSPQGREIAHDGMARAGELTNAATEKGSALVQDGKAKAADLTSRAQETAGNMGQRIGDLAQSGKQTAANLPAQARDTASNISGATAENVRNLPESGTNAINNAPGAIKSTLNNAQSHLPGALGGNSDGSRSAKGGATNTGSQLSDSAAGTQRQRASEDFSD